MWKSSGSSGWWGSSSHLWEWAQPVYGGSSFLLILHRMFFFLFCKLWLLGLHGAQFKKAIKSPFHMGPPPVGRDIQVRCNGCQVQARAEIWVCKLPASQSLLWHTFSTQSQNHFCCITVPDMKYSVNHYEDFRSQRNEVDFKFFRTRIRKMNICVLVGNVSSAKHLINRN